MGVSMFEWFFLLVTLWMPTSTQAPTPSASDLYQYMPDDAVAMVSLDVRNLARGLLKRAESLRRLPFIAKVPGVAKRYDRAYGEFKRTHLKEIVPKLGADPLKVLDTVTVAFSPPMEKPGQVRSRELVLAVFRGAIPRSVLHKVAKLQGLTKRSRVGRFVAYLSDSDSRPSLAWRKGVLLVGTQRWVYTVARRGPRSRWNPDSLAGRMTVQYQPKTLFAAGYKATAMTTRELVREAGGPFKSLARPLDGAYLGVQLMGQVVTVWSRDKPARARYAKLLGALGEWLQASDHLIQGLLHVADALMDHRDPLRSKLLRELFRQKGSLLQFVRSRLSAPKTLSRIERGADWTRLRVSGNATNGSLMMLGFTMYMGLSMPHEIKGTKTMNKVPSKTIRPKQGP